MIYNNRDGYSKWFKLLNEVVVVVSVIAIVIVLVLGIEYRLCVGNW